MIDAVDVGNEVRKQSVPKHRQMPEARKNEEVLYTEKNEVRNDGSSEKTAVMRAPEREPGCKAESE